MKTILYVWFAMFAVAPMLAPAAKAMSRSPELPVLLLLPERYSVLQVAFDLDARRPVILTTYRVTDAGTVTYHAWNGSDWVYVSADDFREVNFLRFVPREAILVGDAGVLDPRIEEAVKSWCRRVWKIESLATSDLVNGFGEVLRFRDREWAWFAARYNLELKDANEARRKDSWYYHPFVESKGPAPGVGASDEFPAVPVEDLTGEADEAAAAELDRPPLRLPLPQPADTEMEPETLAEDPGL